MKEVFEKIRERLEGIDCDDKWCGDCCHCYRKEAIRKAIEIVNQVAEEYAKTPTPNHPIPIDTQMYIAELEKNAGWIPVSERLPEDGDCGFYMCIVENHEEDLPMFCQFEEEYGFGFRHDIYDEHTLGFVDSEFRTNEELGYEKVIAWQPLPAPFKPKGEQS